MKRLRLVGVVICFCLAFFSAVPVHASCGCKITYEDGSQKSVLGYESIFFNNVVGCSCSDDSGTPIAVILLRVVNFLYGSVAVLATLGFILVGVSYMSARDNAAQVIKAKRRCFEIVIGIAGSTLLWTIMNWLIPGGVFNFEVAEKVRTMEALSKEEVAALENEQSLSPAASNPSTSPSSPSTTKPPTSTKPPATTTPSTPTTTPSTPTTTPSAPTTTPSTPTTTPTTPSTPTTTPSAPSTPSVPSSGAGTTFISYYETGTNANFLLYVPSTAEGRKLPLIVYLHGDSGGGLGAEQFKYIVGLNEFSNWNINSLNGINAYVLCPQTKSGSINWDNSGIAARNEVWNKVKSMVSEGKVDSRRVSIMGQSRGSYGVQRFVTDADRVGRFSAAVLLSGYRNWNVSDLSAAPPMKFIYGGNDAGPKGQAQYFTNAEIKEYPGEGHDSVIKKALLDDANHDNKSDLIEWTLSKTSSKGVQ